MAHKKPLEEGNVQSYAIGQAVKKTFPNNEIQLDHIPSKKAIALAYFEETGIEVTPKLINTIHKETTTLARAKETHRESPTSKINVKLAHLDKDVLALAAVRDLIQYKAQEIERGILTPQKIENAIAEVHRENYALGIYTKEEVEIANKYTQRLQEVELNKHVHTVSYEEIAKEYHAEFKEPPKINTEIFENRLAKPSIIVGATLASMVFTEEADASSIPTLHLSTDTTKFDTLTTNEKLGAEIGAGFNAINAIQATEEFKSGANKSATTLLDTNAYKQGLEQATDAWRPSATKEVVKLGAMDSAKVAGKSFLKKLPLVGLGAGVVFGIGRAIDGDWKGAGMEVASGAFSLVPGWGTAASVGMDAALLEKDTALLSHGAEKLLGKENQETLTQSEDNHTTIEPNQNLNLSSDVEKDGFEYNEDGMLILTGDNVVSMDDIAYIEEESYDSLAKAQEIALSVYNPQNDNMNDMGMERD